MDIRFVAEKELEIAGGQDGMTEKCKIMKHLEVVFLAVIVVIYPFLFAIIYEMRHIRRRSRDLPLFPAPSDSLSRRLKFRILESYGYAYNQLFQAKE